VAQSGDHHLERARSVSAEARTVAGRRIFRCPLAPVPDRDAPRGPFNVFISCRAFGRSQGHRQQGKVTIFFYGGLAQSGGTFGPAPPPITTTGSGTLGGIVPAGCELVFMLLNGGGVMPGAARLTEEPRGIPATR
jgi:hypothetical protein